LGERPLLWVWNSSQEFVWIWFWSLIGAIIIWRCYSLFYSAIITGIASIILSGICFIFLFTLGGWIPLIPAFFALLGTSAIAFLINSLRRGKTLNNP